MNRAERRRTAREISEALGLPFPTVYSAVRWDVHVVAIARTLEERDKSKRPAAFTAAVNALVTRARNRERQ